MPGQLFASLTALAQRHLRCAINESRVLHEGLFGGFSSAVAACVESHELVRQGNLLMAGTQFRHHDKHNANVPFRGAESGGIVAVDEQGHIIEKNLSTRQT